MNEELKQLLQLSSRIRERIIAECRITRATFSNWQNGKTPIPFWAEGIIDAIVLKEAGKTVFSQQDEIIGMTPK
jgi:hypothetical protein